jgi:hypothetical protein
MNVKIGTEAAQIPEKEYINRIFVAVQSPVYFLHPWQRGPLYRVRALLARAKDISTQYRIVLCLVCLLVILPRLNCTQLERAT